MKNLFVNILRFSRSKPKKGNPPLESSQDYVANAIGVFGLWQCTVCTIAVFTRFIVMWNMTSMLFLTPETDFVCVEFKEPPVAKVANSTCYDGCLKYEYHNQGLHTTPITDYGLICERQWLASLAQSILMFGVLLGTTLFGWMSDRFGRRISLIISIVMNVIFMLATPFSPNFWIFSCFRFITGIAIGGAMTIPIVYVMEIVGNDLREIASCGIVQPDGLAQASLAIFAYYSPTWNIYAFSYGAIAIIILVLVVFVPESPRWLISRGRIDEAIKVITKAAKCNKRDTSRIEENIKKSVEDLKIDNKETVDASYIDFFKKKSLGMRLCCVFVLWSISGTCFFGINQYLTFVGSNLYVAVVIQGLIQMPVGVIGWLINKYFGRKCSSIGVLVVSGIIMILLIFAADYYWATTILGVIGFGAINSIFGIIYVYVSELFPTPMRNMAFGAASIGAKFGAMTAPFIANLRPQWVPCLVFAAILFAAIGFCLPLPETKGQTLKDTID